jgi:manganese/zinc/iron transport system permease protein
MSWTDLDTWIVVTAVLISMACALPGLFLILNKQSMLGDAISHAVLPGIAIAFLATASREPWAMLAGAVAAGLFTGIITQWVHRYGQVESGAALGVVFCSLFALGLILIRAAADRVDLDPSCVLYGTIETAVIDFEAVPRIAWMSGLMLVVNVLLTGLFYKELKLSAFDSAFATAQGVSSEWVRHGLTVVTAVTTVMAFESVGSILVIAMLIVPGATALLISHRLPVVVGITLVAAAFAAALGHAAAISVFPAIVAKLAGIERLGAASSAGMMATVAGGIFLLVLLARPRFYRKFFPLGLAEMKREAAASLR